jgi:acetyl esterase
MALDPKFRPVLEMPGMQLGAPPPGVTAAMVREAAKQMLPPIPPPPIQEVRDIEVKGPAGMLRVRLYYPSHAGNLPLVVFYHGGGFVLCDLDSHDMLCRSLANESGCAFASVEYRLSPEAKFPAPLEDCYAALVQLTTRASELGFDAQRVAVAGDSAGGNLAAAVCLLARDRRGPAIQFQLLLYPCLDAGCAIASQHEFAKGYMLTREVLQWFYECYVAQPADGANPLVSPLEATDLSGLPPASITTAECDPLRDEGELYGERLRAAGVNAITRRYDGMIHGFTQMALITEVANNNIADVARDLRAALVPHSANRTTTALKLYQSTLAGDWATVDSLITDDFTIIEASDLPFGGTYRGRQALQQLFAALTAKIALTGAKIVKILADGNDAIAIIELDVNTTQGASKLAVMERLRFRGDRICAAEPFYFDAAAVQRAAQLKPA